ncbi:uncharacterized protein MELLADRAFT_66989 [Melampsora larici-populina 98AG31]|uniref:Uncharacterized protein n=1 Tax=Melampsora larici-populina (strain 98AG31 / pathotype 3-4-7) TaxID=747676 RepID=F4S1D6_MELLP|nr:uncharacterized protein MELLADRAFT_66989 [Melampsora larici-populina 98AG31]EGG01544.1 hypothetical protein MELLADRAFT_66989 [Melampsora larici-populina 98AG31]
MDKMSNDFNLLSEIVKKALGSEGADGGRAEMDATSKKINTCGGAVSCRDYTGVSLESNGMAMIKKAVQAHIQSLANGNLSLNSVSSQIITYSCQSFFKSRYQKQSWDAERLKSQINTIGRTSRLRYLKKLRDQVVIENKNKALWKLLDIIDVACSDVKTNDEDCSANTPNSIKAPLCHILKLNWRSPRLDVPKTPCSSPSRGGGRPSRPHMQSESGRKSQIQPPEGLPIDFFVKTGTKTFVPNKNFH